MESCYFQWYEKAVEAELKIAQLYEYYMASVVPADFHRSASEIGIFVFYARKFIGLP